MFKVLHPFVHKLVCFRQTPPTVYIGSSLNFIARSQYSKYWQSYAPSKISVNFSFLANSHSLHPIKLKLDLLLDHGMEQCILFQDCSTQNISRVMPL